MLRTSLPRQICTALAPSVIEPPPTVTIRSAPTARACSAAAITASRGVCGGIASKVPAQRGPRPSRIFAISSVSRFSVPLTIRNARVVPRRSICAGIAVAAGTPNTTSSMAPNTTRPLRTTSVLPGRVGFRSLEKECSGGSARRGTKKSPPARSSGRPPDVHAGRPPLDRRERSPDTPLPRRDLRLQRHRNGWMQRALGAVVDRDVLPIGLGTAPDRERGDCRKQRGVAGDRPPAPGPCHQSGRDERRRAAGQDRAQFAREGKAGKSPLRREQFGKVGGLRAEHRRRPYRARDDEGSRGPYPFRGRHPPEEWI